MSQSSNRAGGGTNTMEDCPDYPVFENLKVTTGSALREDTNCLICDEGLDKNPTITHETCKRSFHIYCLEEWLLNSTPSTCPLCRESLAHRSTDPLGSTEMEQRISRAHLAALRRQEVEAEEEAEFQHFYQHILPERLPIPFHNFMEDHFDNEHFHTRRRYRLPDPWEFAQLLSWDLVTETNQDILFRAREARQLNDTYFFFERFLTRSVAPHQSLVDSLFEPVAVFANALVHWNQVAHRLDPVHRGRVEYLVRTWLDENDEARGTLPQGHHPDVPDYDDANTHDDHDTESSDIEGGGVSLDEHSPEDPHSDEDIGPDNDRTAAGS